MHTSCSNRLCEQHCVKTAHWAGRREGAPSTSPAQWNNDRHEVWRKISAACRGVSCGLPQTNFAIADFHVPYHGLNCQECFVVLSSKKGCHCQCLEDRSRQLLNPVEHGDFNRCSMENVPPWLSSLQDRERRRQCHVAEAAEVLEAKRLPKAVASYWASRRGTGGWDVNAPGFHPSADDLTRPLAGSVLHGGHPFLRKWFRGSLRSPIRSI
jgi:hypothetical protein